MAVFRISYLFFLLLSVSFSSQAQIRSTHFTDTVSIYPDFQETVEKHISEVDVTLRLPEWVYYNRLYANMYENDKLILSTKDSAVINLYFQSFYYWQDDTLVILGLYKLNEGFGFSLKIHEGKAKLSYLLFFDEVPMCSYSENGPLSLKLEVPCSDATIILSEIPDPKLNYTTYGYVKFRSADYYISKGSGDGEEFLPRIKARADMKIYFRSDPKPY